MRGFNKFSFVFVSHIIQHIYVEGYCVSHKLGGPAQDEEVVVPAYSVTGEIETDRLPSTVTTGTDGLPGGGCWQAHLWALGSSYVEATWVSVRRGPLSRVSTEIWHEHRYSGRLNMGCELMES